MGTGEVEVAGLDWMAFMRTSTSVENWASGPVFFEASLSGELVWLLAEL
jgi:hypothetical protein